ncbi:MAG: HAD-IC family P-type ATPase [Candidatus Omnitrophica bacterium]|nr:HAD-IC family P-type ATPase [Candidatus Omnitrophota bacterium]
MKNFWQQDILEAAKNLNSHPESGISGEEAAIRLAQYGRNALRQKKAVSPIKMFLEQFNDFMIWVLVAAALVSGFLQEWIDAAAIIGIVILNAILGFIQEYRAEKSLAALKKLSSPQSKVIRSGEHKIIPSSDIVPGDIVELEAGDHVPADSRMVWLTSNFATQEASLTGESVPVNKTTVPLEKEEVPLSERANAIYLGTAVVSGKGRAMVFNTGMNTELGKIATMIQDIEHESTPLQKKLEEFGKWIVYLCFILVAMVFALGVFRGGFGKENLIEMFLTAVSLAVAAIPEGLPAVVTIALALGVQRMVKRHALIRKLPSVETLGCATVICSDKTGTLTKNEMTVQGIFCGNKDFRVSGIGYDPDGQIIQNEKEINPQNYPDLNKAFLCALLCNGAQLVEKNNNWSIIGDPTEGALLTAAAKAGLNKKDTEAQYLFVEEIPFDSERKKMTIVRKDKEGKLLAFVKGAPDILLGDCVSIEEKGVMRRITEADRSRILEMNTNFANQAMRVLAVAYRPLERAPEKYEAAAIERDLVFLGLFAMIDPPREEVKQAIKLCKNAGIRTVMITGDHKNTAVAIARELGFFAKDSLAGVRPGFTRA